MTSILKIIILLIYPSVLLLSFFLFYRKYKNIIKNYYLNIIINSIVISLIVCFGLLVFFHFEDTIYAYDYAGHWIRALNLRQMFFDNPANILPTVYNSMNYANYSCLPALFELPLMLIKTSYKWFSLVNYVLFLLPTIAVLQVLYFKYFNKNKYLPILLTIIIYPLYLTLFYGKVDCSGLLFITLAYSLVVIPDFDEIDMIDNLAINLFAFLAIFLRRWYLYSIVCLYISYFIKWLFYKNKKASDLLKMLSSGIVLLVVALIFFVPFILNSLNNNFEETYAFYNNDGKLLSFINNVSPLICALSLIGCIKLFKNNKALLFANVVSIIVPCLLIWRIQSFEYHHYYIFLFNVIVLFVCGLSVIENYNKIINIVLIALLTGQPFIIFSGLKNTMPLFTDIRKSPEVLEDKNELISLSEYVRSIEPDNNTSAFLSAGSYGIITDDLLRNALLPDLNAPVIDSAVFDIRDGFPRDMQYIKYVITVDPIVYTSQEYQHMFDVISNGIKNNKEISSIYNPIHSTKLYDKYTVTVYERVGEYTDDIKEYFYKEMLKYYPDKEEFYSYIID